MTFQAKEIPECGLTLTRTIHRRKITRLAPTSQKERPTMGNEKIGPECFPGSDYQDLNTPEPDPRPSAEPAAWDLVIADMRERDRLGTKKYGQRLTPGDGRNSLVDAYQEVLDAAVYLRKAIHEVEKAKREGYMLALEKFSSHQTGPEDTFQDILDDLAALAPGEAE